MKQIFNFDTHSNYTSTNIPKYINSIALCKEEVDVHYIKSVYEGDEDVVPILYLESAASGSCYINTGLVGNIGTCYFYVDYYITTTGGTEQEVWGSWPTVQWNLRADKNESDLPIVSGTHGNNQRIVRAKALTGSPTTPICIFAWSGATWQSHNVRIYRYYVKRTNNTGEYIQNFIPVRAGNVGYMYETVSGRLFTNAGTSPFILGPDI